MSRPTMHEIARRSREAIDDAIRIESIRKQLEQSQDIEQVRAIARPFLDAAVKTQRKVIMGEVQ